MAVDSQNNVYVGVRAQDASNDYDVILLKYDSAGTLEWTYFVDSAGSDLVYDVIVGDDDLPVFVGGTTPGSDSDMFAIKLNADGSEAWKVVLDPGDHDYFFGVAEAADGVVAAGRSIRSGNYDGYVVKISDSGAVEWERRIDIRNRDTLKNPIVLADGSIIAVGDSYSSPCPCPWETLVAKLTPSGGLSWTDRREPSSGYNRAQHAVEGTDGNVYVTATYRGGPSGNYDSYYTLKYSPNGALLWDNRYDPGAHMSSAQIYAADDGVFIASKVGTSTPKAQVVHITSSGARAWTTDFPEWQAPYGGVADDGSLILAAVKDIATNDRDLMAAKVNRDGSTAWEMQHDGLEFYLYDAVPVGSDGFAYAGITYDGSQRDTLVGAFGMGPAGPRVDFEWDPPNPTDLDRITFTDLSQGRDGNLTDWAWDFGDGATSTQQNPTHQYADDGDYTVTLTVTDDLGLTASLSQTISVANVGPTAAFTAGNAGPTDPNRMIFTDQSTDDDGQVTAWAWDFGDGATSTQQHPEHAYAEAGTYTVCLTATDDDAASGEACEEIDVGLLSPPAVDCRSAFSESVCAALPEPPQGPGTPPVPSEVGPGTAPEACAGLPGESTCRYGAEYSDYLVWEYGIGVVA